MLMAWTINTTFGEPVGPILLTDLMVSLKEVVGRVIRFRGKIGVNALISISV